MPDPREKPDAESDIEVEGHEVAEQSGDEETEQDAQDGADEVGVPEEDAEEVDAPARRPSRAESRIQRLREEAAEAKREAAETRRRLEEFEARQRSAVPAGETPEQKAQRYALMTSEERMEARLADAQSGFEQKLGMLQFQSLEAGDKAAFRALTASDLVAAKYAEEVETRLADMRRKGQNVDRETLLTFIIGEKVRAKAKTAKAKAKDEGERRIERATTRPTRAQGDQPTAREQATGAAARRKRLENVTF